MALRYIKISLTIFIALFGLLSAGQNLVNLDAAFFALASVMGMEGHTIYTNHLGPAMASPALVWLGLAGIILGELMVGVLAAKGAWDMWQARAGKGEAFNAAKKFTVMGAGLALVVWFGLFTVIGGAYFLMWQTSLGAGSLANAFQFVGTIGVTLFFIHLKDE